MKKTVLRAILPRIFRVGVLGLGVLGFSTVSVLAADATAAGDPAQGEQKAATCTACHGPNGNSSNPEWPSLAGQHAGYLIKQLQNFKNGERVNALMSGMAAPLSEQDMLDLAAFYSTQAWQPAGAADPELVQEGEMLFRGGDFDRGIPACTGCHSPIGGGNPSAGYPLVRGQHAKYTELQLYAFRNGERANDPNQMMRQVANKMSDRQIQAVASFIQGLRP